MVQWYTVQTIPPSRVWVAWTLAPLETGERWFAAGKTLSTFLAWSCSDNNNGTLDSRGWPNCVSIADSNGWWWRGLRGAWLWVTSSNDIRMWASLVSSWLIAPGTVPASFMSKPQGCIHKNDFLKKEMRALVFRSTLGKSSISFQSFSQLSWDQSIVVNNCLEAFHGPLPTLSFKYECGTSFLSYIPGGFLNLRFPSGGTYDGLDEEYRINSCAFKKK